MKSSSKLNRLVSYRDVVVALTGRHGVWHRNIMRGSQIKRWDGDWHAWTKCCKPDKRGRFT